MNFPKVKMQGSIWISLLLWLMVLGTYNTDISRVLASGFPHNFLDLVHGLRVFLPFIALLIAVIILIRRRHHILWKSPLGLLSIFVVIGLGASIFSKYPFFSLYWGVLYGTVIVILAVALSYGDPKENIKAIIKLNGIIAGLVAVGLLIFFLWQPGVVKSLTYNVFICQERPFESLGHISFQMDIFGMAGTRPTGLGRYAGFSAVIALAYFFLPLSSRKRPWLGTFLLLFTTLLFSKGRTELLAFFVAAASMFILSREQIRRHFGLIAFLSVTFLMSLVVILYNIPCTNISPVLYSQSPLSPLVGTSASSSEKAPPVSPVTFKSHTLTLSGRATEIWPAAWKLFLTSPIIGRGFQADRYFLNGQHAHNSLMHTLVESGLLGTGCFVFAFLILLLMLRDLLRSLELGSRERGFLVVLSGILVFFLVRGITESLAFFSADWLFVAPIIAYIQCIHNELREREKSLFRFAGLKINAVQMSEVVEKISFWIKNEKEKFHFVVVTGMHGVVESSRHVDLKSILNSADLFVPDGISLVWLAKLKGVNIERRVSGADLMAEFFKVSEKEGFNNYFYGDTNDTLQKLLGTFPNLKADSYSPPYRELTKEEDEEVIQRINQAKPAVLWVALGLPKQERWIYEHKDKLKVPVVIGVGAAFKFLSGTIKRAPKWIGDLGFEWLWRLVHEPKIIWRRVFVDGPVFLWLIVKHFVQGK